MSIREERRKEKPNHTESCTGPNRVDARRAARVLTFDRSCISTFSTAFGWHSVTAFTISSGTLKPIFLKGFSAMKGVRRGESERKKANGGWAAGAQGELRTYDSEWPSYTASAAGSSHYCSCAARPV